MIFCFTLIQGRQAELGGESSAKKVTVFVRKEKEAGQTMTKNMFKSLTILKGEDKGTHCTHTTGKHVNRYFTKVTGRL